jgi:hypothetical protein
MAETPTVMWPGDTGISYRYEIYPIETTLAARAGNYIFAKKATPHHWTPVYVGETADLSLRLYAHHQDDCITRNGATHIHAHVSDSGNQARRDEECAIRRLWKPPCNEQ